MPAALDVKASRGAAAAVEWLPVIAGLLVLYVPTFYGLSATLWRYDDYAHSPIILGIIIWLIWKKRAVLLEVPAAARPAAGLALLVFGLLLYAAGRAQAITVFEVASLAPILAGVFLAMRGWAAVRALWFPIVFIVFMVPLPQFFVDALSGPLKQSVSAIAEEFLYAAGYPVARTGVVLAIGQYVLLVADACSGLNSMFSLMAVGTLYLHLMQHRSWLHNGLILLSLLPVAVCANIVRVIVLVLVTYRFGDAAGQGFMHRFSGMLLFATALLVILLLDAILARAIKSRAPA